MNTLSERLDQLTGTYTDIWTALGSLGQGSIPDVMLPTPSDGIICTLWDASQVQVLSGDLISGDAFALHTTSLEEMQERNLPLGENLRMIGNMQMVYLYQEWDELHRHRIAKKLGVEYKKLTVPVFGDLRRFRHDIIHSKGISTKQYSAETEVLSAFSEGTDVRFDVDCWFKMKAEIECWLSSLK